PPKVVAGLVDSRQRSPAAGQVVKLTALLGLVNLPLDPRFPSHPGRLALGHSRQATAVSLIPGLRRLACGRERSPISPMSARGPCGPALEGGVCGCPRGGPGDDRILGRRPGAAAVLDGSATEGRTAAVDYRVRHLPWSPRPGGPRSVCSPPPK